MKELFDALLQLNTKPPLFEPGEKKFWDDPHVSKSMLEAHLNPDSDAASRKPEKINATIQHLFASGILKPGMKVLDLGCGPGLYTEKIAEAGCEVTGLDLSQGSLDYARKHAKESELDIDYRCMNFFDMDYSDTFDAALQIYGEMNTFSDAARDRLLGLIRNALKKNGKFVFDITTRVLRMKYGLKTNWYISDGGFWSPGKHLVLERGFDYPEDSVWLDQFIVMEPQKCRVFRNWFHDYTFEGFSEVLSKTGFHVKNVWNDLTGTVYKEGGEWIAIAAEAQK